MNLIDSLERRFGRYAIPGLIRGIVILNALVFLLGQLNPVFTSWLTLDVRGIGQGEFWRIFTYILVPDSQRFLFVLLALWFLWTLGEGLEQAWGAFRLNLFYLVGMIGTTVAALFFGAQSSNFLLNTSLLFAFARFYPDLEFYVLGILPVRVKWIAGFTAAILLLQAFQSSNSYRMALLASLANLIIFFGPELIATVRQRQDVSSRRQKFSASSIPEDEPLNRCVVCRRSSRSNPELEFRVGRDGNDYCTEHLPRPAAR